MLSEIVRNVPVFLLLVAFFGASIFVHELGHYLVARWCGLVIEVFSIGFGPAIWKKKINGVVYKIGWFPIGGYVALPQLDPSGMSRIQGEGEEQRELPSVAAWRKILVSLAGSAGNILLAVVIAWIVYWIGMPAGPAERSSAVGYVLPESEAYERGLRTGDEILTANGVKIGKWSDLRMEAAMSREVTLNIRTPEGEEKAIVVSTKKGVLGEQMVPGIDGRNLCKVMSVEKGMSAHEAGVVDGDMIVGFAGGEVYSRSHLVELVNAHIGEPSSLVVKRTVDGEAVLVELAVTPAPDEKLGRARIGIMFNLAAVEHDTVIRPLPSEQLRHHAGAIFRFLRALVTPREAKAASAAVGGPVAILASYWLIMKTSVILAVWFTGFLNVNLAIINVLPIPVLDGGHVIFSLWEMILRRPMNARFVNALVNVFAVLLIGIIILLSVRDMDRFTPLGRYCRELFGGGGNDVDASGEGGD